MKQSRDFQYTLFLVRKALVNPLFTTVCGITVAAILLSFLIAPYLPIFGFITLATAIYVGLETVILRFPSELHTRFQEWFTRYHYLHEKNPQDSGITLEGSPVDPDYILANLIKMNRDHLSPMIFQQIAKNIDASFVKAENKINEAHATKDTIILKTISQDFDEDMQRVTREGDAYLSAMNSVYTLQEDMESSSSEKQEVKITRH